MDVISIGETMVLFTPETKGQMRYARSYSSKIAGAETNTLIGLAKLGVKTGWISRLGKDEFGAFVINAVRGEGVDTSQVLLDDKAPTGIFFKELINEENVRVHYYRKGSAASKLLPSELNEEYIGSSNYLYITGITPALSESCRMSIFSAIDMAKNYGKKVVFDPNIRRKLWSDDEARKTLLSIAEKSDIVLPGFSEGEFLFQISNLEEITDKFHELGVEIVVIKLGENGAYLSTKKEKKQIDGFKVAKIVDPVGAGDGFAAGFLSGLIDGHPLEEAVRRGCAVGAMVVTVNGDIEGLPDREMLDSFLRSTEREDIFR